MADAKRPHARPLSPHLQIYRIQMTSVSSILTRITGNGLIVGTMLAVWWLLAAATSDDYFAVADTVATSWFGDLVFTASLWAIWYHYLAGLRHLLFDAGRGLDVPTAEKLGWACIIGAFVLTAVTIFLVQ
jgi:succinate dehydrogenase / fumarate reductase, cytochrome b subunit